MEATLVATSKQSLSTARFSHTLFLGILMYIAQFVRRSTITICISTMSLRKYPFDWILSNSEYFIFLSSLILQAFKKNLLNAFFLYLHSYVSYLPLESSLALIYYYYYYSSTGLLICFSNKKHSPELSTFLTLNKGW